MEIGTEQVIWSCYDVICVGDFNSNLLDPKDSGHLKDLLEVYGLENLIKLPTRI